MQLNEHNTDFGRGLARWYSMGNSGKPHLSFLGANGHAVTTYPFFLRRLANEYFIEAIECRAAWLDAPDPVGSVKWQHLTKDYLAFLKARKMNDGSFIHVGHSMGGSVGVLAAMRHPEWFKALVVIEPGGWSSRWARFWLKYLPQKSTPMSKMISSTSNRRFEFDSREEFLESMRTKRTYHNFTEEALRDYAEGGLVKVDNGYQLKYSGKWEGSVFSDSPYIWQYFSKLKVPTLLIRAEHTNLQKREDFLKLKQRCKLKNPRVSFVELPDLGHMVVQENPDLVSETILAWLKEHGISA